jgi:CRISPR-associated protein Cmr3
MWPSPVDAAYLEDEIWVRRLDPQPSDVPTVGVEAINEEARERLWWPRLDEKTKPEDGPRWWTEADFVDWLVGNQVAKASHEAQEALRLPYRDQSHVRIDPTSDTAVDGFLYSTRVCESLVRDTEERAWIEWSVAIDCELPEEGALVGRRIILGGKGKLAAIAAAPPALFGRPQQLDSAFAARPAGLRLVVVTPALFEAGWCPDGFRHTEAGYVGTIPGITDGLRLVAALVPRPQHLSGWDMAKRQPKATERLVSPGSVYFLTKTNGQPFEQDDAERLWLAQLGNRTREGFGCVVPGVWVPREQSTGAEIKP